VLDAALSGGPHDIAAGKLTLWVGGDEAVLEEIRPVLDSYASPVMEASADDIRARYGVEVAAVPLDLIR
jgi:3-hydroxyisobutyrate dehydrogenase-like beta-hydroxyacid dehydrogenase